MQRAEAPSTHCRYSYTSALHIVLSCCLVILRTFLIQHSTEQASPLCSLGRTTNSFMAALIKYTLFNPVITGPLLYIFTIAPQGIQQPILQSLNTYVSYVVLERAVIALKLLFALGIISTLNAFFSELAQNNFRWKSEQHRYDWPKEIAVVTGGASGFGRLISEGFASHGLRVMALDIHDSLPAEMQSNKKIHYYKCDITSVEAVNATAEAIRSEHGNPSILINNAGVAFEGNILSTEPKNVRRIFDVNTISHYWTVNAFLPSMIAQHKGHIVTLASMASFISAPVSSRLHQPYKSRHTLTSS